MSTFRDWVQHAGEILDFVANVKNTRAGCLGGAVQQKRKLRRDASCRIVFWHEGRKSVLEGQDDFIFKLSEDNKKSGVLLKRFLKEQKRRQNRPFSWVTVEQKTRWKDQEWKILPGLGWVKKIYPRSKMYSRCKNTIHIKVYDLEMEARTSACTVWFAFPSSHLTQEKVAKLCCLARRNGKIASKAFLHNYKAQNKDKCSSQSVWVTSEVIQSNTKSPWKHPDPTKTPRTRDGSETIGVGSGTKAATSRQPDNEWTKTWDLNTLLLIE